MSIPSDDSTLVGTPRKQRLGCELLPGMGEY